MVVLKTFYLCVRKWKRFIYSIRKMIWHWRVVILVWHLPPTRRMAAELYPCCSHDMQNREEL